MQKSIKSQSVDLWITQVEFKKQVTIRILIVEYQFSIADGQGKQADTL